MKYFLNKCLVPMVVCSVLAACGNVTSEVENKLNELKSKTDSLDAIINKEVDKVLTLDSLINKESEKVRKLDTLLNKSTSQLDSISRKGNRILEKITK